MPTLIALLLAVLFLAVSGCKGTSESGSSFRLEFPADTSLGELWLVEDVNCFTCGTGAKHLGQAVGTHDVQLPAAHWYVSLRMPKEAAHLMPRLNDPTLSKIGDLQLQGTDVTDDDLRHVADINLQSIDLSNTNISGEGLKYLKPNERWIFVDLSACNVLDPKYLVQFRGWRKSTIRLTSRVRSGSATNGAELDLLEQAKQIICDGQSESACGTQIR